MIKKWAGIFPAITTKFKGDYSLDLDLMEKHADWLVHQGVHGIIVNGSLGEASTLTLPEKMETLKAVIRVVHGRVPVLNTIAENATLEGAILARQSEIAGASGLMVLPGLRYILDREEVKFHYRHIADASGLPIMLYNNPISYGTDITPDLFLELAENPKLMAIKESSGDLRRISEIRRLLGDRYALFTGVDDLALESLFMGADGWVAGLVTAFPAETVALYDLVKEGKMAEARKLYHWFLPLLRLDVSVKLVQNIKLVECGVTKSSEIVRPPRLPLSGDERRYVLKVLEQALETRPSFFLSAVN